MQRTVGWLARCQRTMALMIRLVEMIEAWGIVLCVINENYGEIQWKCSVVRDFDIAEHQLDLWPSFCFRRINATVGEQAQNETKSAIRHKDQKGRVRVRVRVD